MSSRRIRPLFSPGFDHLGSRVAPTVFVPAPDPGCGDTSLVMTGLGESASANPTPTTMTYNGDTLILSGPGA